LGQTVVLFVSSSCGPCQALATKLRASPPAFASHAAGASRTSLLLVTDAAGRATYDSLPGVSRIVVQDQADVAKAFGVTVSPFAIAITANGTVAAAGVPSSGDDLEAFALAMPADDTVTGGIVGDQLATIRPLASAAVAPTNGQVV
jgi:hypothetical protein